MDIDDCDSGSDEGVGYGRPPRAHQFKPGQSGNKKGRPKGSRSLKTLVAEELDKRVKVRVNGRSRYFTKGEIISNVLVNKALEGNLKAIAQLANLQKDDKPPQVEKDPFVGLRDENGRIRIKLAMGEPPSQERLESAARSAAEIQRKHEAEYQGRLARQSAINN